MSKFSNEEIRRMNEAIAIGKDDSKVLLASSVTVDPLGTCKVEMVSYHSFIPERVIIPCICEKDFRIIEMTVNGVVQTFVKKGMPASVFSEENFCSQMKMDSCPCSAKIIVVACNIRSAKRTFTIAIAGSKVKDLKSDSSIIMEKSN